MGNMARTPLPVLAVRVLAWPPTQGPLRTRRRLADDYRLLVCRVGKDSGRERNSPFWASLIGLHEHHQLTKHLAQIPAVDLVNDEDVVPGQVVRCLRTELKEDAISKGEVFLGRAISLNKVLIRIRLMELDHRNTT